VKKNLLGITYLFPLKSENGTGIVSPGQLYDDGSMALRRDVPCKVLSNPDVILDNLPPVPLVRSDEFENPPEDVSTSFRHFFVRQRPDNVAKAFLCLKVSDTAKKEQTHVNKCKCEEKNISYEKKNRTSD